MDTDLLEREAELAAIEGGLDAASGGVGAVLALEGPAGIGKSRLLAAARERAHARAVSFLEARASELERDHAFGVVRQLFEALVLSPRASDRAALLAGPAAPARAVFDQPAAPAPTGAEVAYATLHGLFWLAVNAAERRPLALAIDDTQWCDRPSLDWLGYLARRIDGLAVVLLVALRPLAGGEQRPLAELLATANTQVRPPALSARAARRLLRAALGSSVEPEFAAACQQLSGGNPLLLTEIARALASERVPPRASQCERLRQLAPHAVADAVRARLARLPASAAALARAAAALGERGELRQAARLAGLGEAATLTAADELVGASLLRSGQPPVFVHPVVRDAVYQTLALAERDALHLHAAQLLAAADADAEQVAAQLLRTSPDDRSDTARTLRAAATRALARGAPESAATYLERALAEPPPPSERAQLRAELGTVRLLAGDPAAAGPHFRDALAALSDPDERAAIALQLARCLFMSGNTTHAVEVLDRAVSEPPGKDRDTYQWLLAELLAIALRHPELHHWADERLAEAGREQQLEGTGGRALLCLQAAHDSHLGRARAACVQRVEQALADTALFEQAGDWVCWVAADVLHVADELERARQTADQVRERARANGAIFLYAAACAFRAQVSLASGRLTDAEADARGALEALPHRELVVLPYLASWLTQTLVERGDLDGAARTLALASDPGQRDPTAAAVWRYGRGRLRLARGQTRAGLSDLLDCGEALERVGCRNPAICQWRSHAALALARLGDDQQAAVELAADAVELARTWGAPRPLGAALRAQALVHDADIDLLRESVDTLTASPGQLELAHALTDLGAALRRAGHRAQARDPLRRAVELAHACAATALTEHARSELLATGARPRRLTTTGADALTPSEQRIARLAAHGMTNREIAQELFVVPRTVEMHLSNAFTKLGISSRTQLQSALTAPQPSSAA